MSDWNFKSRHRKLIEEDTDDANRPHLHIIDFILKIHLSKITLYDTNFSGCVQLCLT